MLVLDDACVGRFAVGIVDHGVSLEVGNALQQFVFEAQAAVLQVSAGIVEVSINASGIEGTVSQCGKFGTVLQIVDACTYFDTFEQQSDEAVVASVRDALIGIVEVIVVESEAERKPLDDEGRQFGSGTSPLLFGISFHQILVDVIATQSEGLLLQIAGLADVGVGGALFLQFGLCFGRCAYSP